MGSRYGKRKVEDEESKSVDAEGPYGLYNNNNNNDVYNVLSSHSGARQEDAVTIYHRQHTQTYLYRHIQIYIRANLLTYVLHTIYTLTFLTESEKWNVQKHTYNALIDMYTRGHRHEHAVAIVHCNNTC